MNEILVAIDFSQSSRNALDHAVSIAKKFKSHMLWLWVENSSSIRHLELEKGEDTQLGVQRKFDELISEYKEDISPQDIEIKTVKGSSSKEVVDLAKANSVDLIVVGAHGSHGFRKYLTGTNANNIIAAASCPVITIREHRELGRKLERIVVPIDSSLDTRQKLPLATLLAKAFGAEIHLLGLYFNDYPTIRKRVNNYTEQAEKFVVKSGVKVVIHYTRSKDGARTIMNYAKKINAGLISVMIDSEGKSSSWSLRSQGQQLVNQAPIPILSIANKELIRSRPSM